MGPAKHACSILGCTHNADTLAAAWCRSSWISACPTSGSRWGSTLYQVVAALQHGALCIKDT